jgi:hypothetical protein
VSAYWNQTRSKCKRNGEPKAHRQARYRIASILKAEGYEIDFGKREEGVRLPKIYPELDEAKEYTVDVVGTRRRGKETQNLYIEIDGAIHFSSAIRIAKTKKKHTQIKECLGITLVHLTPEDLVGKYELSDVVVWQEIRKQLSETL